MCCFYVQYIKSGKNSTWQVTVFLMWKSGRCCRWSCCRSSCQCPQSPKGGEESSRCVEPAPCDEAEDAGSRAPRHEPHAGIWSHPQLLQQSVREREGVYGATFAPRHLLRSEGEEVSAGDRRSAEPGIESGSKRKPERKSHSDPGRKARGSLQYVLQRF